MIIGIPREIKNNEYRVSLAPAGVRALVGRGHKVVVERSAGEGSGIPDEEYLEAGAVIRQSPGDIYKEAEMMIDFKRAGTPVISGKGLFLKASKEDIQKGLDFLELM